MNESDANANDRDPWRDRLVDAALRELVGGDGPRDLSERILAAAGTRKEAAAVVTTSGETVMNAEQKRPRGRRWVYLALAACLLIAVGLALTPSVAVRRQAARRAASGDGAAIAPSQASATGASNSRGLQMMVTPHVVVEEKTSAAAPKQNVADEGAGLPALEKALPADGPAQVAIERRIERFSLANSPTDQQGAGRPLTEEDANLSAQNPSRQVVSESVGPLSGAKADQNWARHRAGRFLIHDAYSAGSNLWGDFGGASVAWEDDAAVGLGSEAGQGPGRGGDQYARIVENPFKAISGATTDNRLSTFSIDVDTASYANVRQFLLQGGALPPADAVRIEELVNYFEYDYSAPTDETPFAANVEVAGCPWASEHRLVRLGIKGREMDRSQRPQSNLVFLIDVSGSMDQPNKLPLLLEGLRMLTRELGENDRVAIAVYASSEGLALESTPGTDQSKIMAALDQLKAGGSTAGGAGIQLAYRVAADNFIKGGVNRVILCTDGDFNVGVTSPAELERMAEAQAKETGVFLTVLGFGRGNLNDAMMEQIADKGNGNYHYVDSQSEARKVLVQELSGTLVTIAKDVKIQIEFNPAKAAGYRLIGYENRMLAAEDFNDDKKDAGEIGAGHTVTALYEVVPAGGKVDAAGVDELKYGAATPATAEGVAGEGGEQERDEATEFADELLTLKIRYKAPDGDASTKLEFPVTDGGQDFAGASEDFKFASAVASFGMLLRGSQYKGNATYAAVQEIAQSALGRDGRGYRQEFVKLVERAKELSGQ